MAGVLIVLLIALGFSRIDQTQTSDELLIREAELADVRQKLRYIEQQNAAHQTSLDRLEALVRELGGEVPPRVMPTVKPITRTTMRPTPTPRPSPSEQSPPNPQPSPSPSPSPTPTSTCLAGVCLP